MTMQNTYTPVQQTLLAHTDGAERIAMENAIAQQLFYAVAIDTLCGGYSLAVTGADGLPNAPHLFATREAAQADLQDDIDEYQRLIEEGERDEDDDFDGELIAVRWDGGDTLYLYDEGNQYLLQPLSLAEACGE